MVTAITRLPYGLEQAGGWRGGTLELPAGGPWTDLLTQRVHPPGPVALDGLLARHPVALLTRPPTHPREHA